MPEPLPNDPVLLEKRVRELLAAELLAAAASDPEAIRPRVQERPLFVETEAEWLKIAAIKHPQSAGFETRVVFLSFEGFPDGETDEEDGDCDPLRLGYGIDVLFQQVDKRKDNSNGHDDFTAYLMRLRARLKASPSFGYSNGEISHSRLRTDVPARVEKTDFAIVHRINFSLKVEVNDE